MRRLAFLTLILVLALGGGARAQSMTFTPVTGEGCTGKCRTVILASGVIENDSYERFLAVAAGLPARTPVILHSPGGTLLGGLYLGTALRMMKVRAIVWPGTTCASACAYAFLGGVERHVPPGARLGIHSFYDGDPAAAAGKTARERRDIDANLWKMVRRYVSSMGVGRGFVQRAETTSARSMHWFSGQDLRRHRVVTSDPPARKRPRQASAG